ncbi:protein of unknown function [Methylocella tundrae]|uniref:Uncharacterized protein n=1 Tax=Methylocella tundrae TaxID=227605 RepID=A0A4U8Z4U9_METTU|nr:protein of unknown function [Methylocella tundrae]
MGGMRGPRCTLVSLHCRSSALQSSGHRGEPFLNDRVLLACAVITKCATRTGGGSKMEKYSSAQFARKNEVRSLAAP